MGITDADMSNVSTTDEIEPKDQKNKQNEKENSMSD
jgi:hypothetical protein